MQDDNQNPPALSPPPSATTSGASGGGRGDGSGEVNELEKIQPPLAEPAPLSLPAREGDQEGVGAVSPLQHPAANSTSNLPYRLKMREGQIRKLDRRLKKVWDFAKTKSRVTNDDIKKHLQVSDATAHRYARELTRRGLFKRSGRTRGAYYEAL